MSTNYLALRSSPLAPNTGIAQYSTFTAKSTMVSSINSAASLPLQVAGTTYATLTTSGMQGVSPIQVLLLSASIGSTISGTIGVNTTGQTYNVQGVKSMIVRMCGGGGGGGGANNATGGSNGINTSINQNGYATYYAYGGTGGGGGTGGVFPPSAYGGTYSTGGTAGGGVATGVILYGTGGYGGSGVYQSASVAAGGQGGATMLLGCTNGSNTYTNSPCAGTNAPGFGTGGNGASGSPAIYFPSSGGGGGGYIEVMYTFNTIATSSIFTYQIGGGGAGGPGAYLGGNGASGVLQGFFYA